MNDIELVQRMRSGDERAFDEFFDAYFPRLFHFASHDLKVRALRADTTTRSRRVFMEAAPVAPVETRPAVAAAAATPIEDQQGVCSASHTREV